MSCLFWIVCCCSRRHTHTPRFKVGSVRASTLLQAARILSILRLPGTTRYNNVTHAGHRAVSPRFNLPTAAAASAISAEDFLRDKRPQNIEKNTIACCSNVSIDFNSQRDARACTTLQRCQQNISALLNASRLCTPAQRRT